MINFSANLLLKYRVGAPYIATLRIFACFFACFPNQLMFSTISIHHVKAYFITYTILGDLLKSPKNARAVIYLYIFPLEYT
jgi:hypothetical protein